MVDKIYKLKNAILEQAERELEERGPERIDVNRMGEMVDMVKDLAEAEKDCWKAQYYRNLVTEAMESKYGYSGMDSSQMRQGYGQQSGSMTGQSGMARQGYGSGTMEHADVVEMLGEEFSKLSPHDRMQMKNRVLAKMGSM